MANQPLNPSERCEKEVNNCPSETSMNGITNHRGEDTKDGIKQSVTTTDSDVYFFDISLISIVRDEDV